MSVAAKLKTHTAAESGYDKVRVYRPSVKRVSAENSRTKKTLDGSEVKLSTEAADRRERILATIRGDVSILDLRQNAVSRPLDWRWQRAAYHARTGKPLSRI